MGCFDKVFDGILVQDKLREFFINEHSDYQNIFESSTQQEFIFHLSKLVCVGGALCQAETTFENYKTSIINLYKDLVQVKAKHQGFEITSAVFHIDPEGQSNLFPIPSSHNKFYIIIHSSSHTCTVIYKPFESFC